MWEVSLILDEGERIDEEEEMRRREAYPEDPFHDDHACSPLALIGSGLFRSLLIGFFFRGFREVIKTRYAIEDAQLTQAVTIYQGIAADGAVTL